MTGMSEAVMPIAGGLEIPLRFAPLGVGNIVPEQVFHHGAPQEKKSQWGQLEEYSQSIATVAKSLGDGIERNSVAVGSSCPAKESSVFDRMSASDVEYVQTVESSPQSVKAIASSSVPTVEKPQAGAIESPRAEKPNIAEAAEVKVSEKPIVKAVESPHNEQTKHGSVQDLKIPGGETLKRAETADSEGVRVQKAENANGLAIEGLGVQVHEKSHVQEFGKSDIQAADAVGVRIFQNVYVQTPESVSVSRLVETVVETMAVTPAFATDGEGELTIRLKSDILDGSSIKIEVRDGEFKVVVMPASRAAEEMLLKTQESFQNQLAERVTAWRVNVGVAAFNSRQNGRNEVEEES